jgi:hypothetical protein
VKPVYDNALLNRGGETGCQQALIDYGPNRRRTEPMYIEQYRPDRPSSRASKGGAYPRHDARSGEQRHSIAYKVALMTRGTRTVPE